MLNNNDIAERLLEISGADASRCMKCGRCSASCPAYNRMSIRPHQFVSYIQRGDIQPLLETDGIWHCLSCFCCVERCPRDVKPANLIEATRLLVIRRQGEEYLSADEIESLIDEDTPQQLIVSAFRKYKG